MVYDRLRKVAAATESVKGTAETLADADCDLLVIDPRSNYAPAENEREVVASDLDKFESIPGPDIITISFGVYLKGSGTPETPPTWFKLLQGCGMTQNIGSSDVVLTPASADEDSETLTIALMIGNDSNAHWVEICGARGNASIVAAVNTLPRVNFTFTGALSSIQNANPLTYTSSETTLPKLWRAAQIEIGSFTTGNYGNLSFDMNNEVIMQEDANETDGIIYTEVVDRNPGGSIDPRLVALSTYNPFTKMSTPTAEALQVVFGSGSGELVTLDAPKFQIVNTGDAERQGYAVVPLNFKCRKNTGDDSFTLTHT
jgi:hypothetical protein